MALQDRLKYADFSIFLKSVFAFKKSKNMLFKFQLTKETLLAF